MIKTIEAVISLRPGAQVVCSGGKIIRWDSPDITQPTEAEITAELARLEALEPWNELRDGRNQLLAETDYLALNDVTMSEEMKTYRQALRDLPANTSDPANPTWPTKPGG